MFNTEYYETKKKKLVQKNQMATQKFLSDTMSYARDMSDIEMEFQEIVAYEKEQAEKAEIKPKK